MAMLIFGQNKVKKVPECNKCNNNMIPLNFEMSEEWVCIECSKKDIENEREAIYRSFFE